MVEDLHIKEKYRTEKKAHNEDYAQGRKFSVKLHDAYLRNTNIVNWVGVSRTARGSSTVKDHPRASLCHASLDISLCINRLPQTHILGPPQRRRGRRRCALCENLSTFTGRQREGEREGDRERERKREGEREGDRERERERRERERVRE